jgi:hypothetical protein
MFCEDAVGRVTAHSEEGNDGLVLTFIAYEITLTRSIVLGVVDSVWKCLRFVKDNLRSQSPEVELNDQGQFCFGVMPPSAMFERPWSFETLLLMPLPLDLQARSLMR